MVDALPRARAHASHQRAHAFACASRGMAKLDRTDQGKTAGEPLLGVLKCRLAVHASIDIVFKDALDGQ